MLPSQEELKRIFDYDESTGALTWKYREDAEPEWNTRYAGKPALTTVHAKGYLYGTLLNKSVRAHRVIWKLLYGVEPNKIDHINGVRDDNRKENLRSVTTQENQKNLKKRSDNKSGYSGVQYRKDIGKYRAYITVDKKQVSLGVFETIEEAIKIRKEAEIKYNFHPNHGR
ncbi:HNH endonuclease [Cronobacter phage vB_CsaM_GAP32]|uniref:HNH endonuclease n=1 Tax=Cronobacter phage vB_CsaM_GAP32 TaxID=1141136 RepID=K4F9R1_9CAUD|nr:HNH endonuclease [Cronobacter phage vB_CsaM_GAP32]AFC21950.1 HNH endonuclease [Cronobacter phage vB_CsaM_GAP32]